MTHADCSVAYWYIMNVSKMAVCGEAEGVEAEWPDRQ